MSNNLSKLPVRLMNISNIILLKICMVAVTVGAFAQSPVTIKRDNGVSAGHDDRVRTMWEETVIITVNGPFTLDEVHVYYEGATPGRDTIRIVGDPAEGALPPTSNVWSYNSLVDPIVVEYDGTPGWDTIDLRSAKLHYDGYDRIVIQHRVAEGGPWFAVDNNGVGSNGFSVIYDPFTYPQGFPVIGQYYLAKGDLMVRAVIRYDFPAGNVSQAPPTATLVDVTKAVGLTDASGGLLKSARVSVVDWNGDGWDDIAVGSNFFRNKGDGTFENVSSVMGIQAGASVWGDYDNDGRIDCYAVNGGSGDRIYHNNGDGTFTDVTAASGFSNPYPTVTPIWFDADHDGRLDLYIANGRTEQNGQEEYFPDRLWRGGGDGTFVDITEAAGINPAEMAGSPQENTYLDCWGAAPCDYDGDGWTDIFVATYRLAPDLLYRNNHDGTFSESGAATGVHGEPTAAPYYFGHGIGCDWGDYDNDGDVDVVVGNLGHPDSRGLVSNPSLIYRNDGGPNHAFMNVRREMGLKFFEMNAGVLWLDLDLDGYLDLWHCQYAYNPRGTNNEPRRLSRIYRNTGPAENFRLRDVTWRLGSLIHGAWTAARGDFDRDGALDLVVASPTDALKLFRNNVVREGKWLTLRLKGSPADNVSADAYGTTVRVVAGGKQLLRDLQGGGGGATATQNSNELHFGIGDVSIVDSIVIAYPNGVRKSYVGIAVNSAFDVSYTDGLRLTSGVLDRNERKGALFIQEARHHGDVVLVNVESRSAGGDLRVEVISSSGELIAAADVHAKGREQVMIRPGAPMASGVYFVRVISAEDTVVAKMIVTR